MGATVGLDIGGTKVLGVLLDDGRHGAARGAPAVAAHRARRAGRDRRVDRRPARRGRARRSAWARPGSSTARGDVVYAPNLPNVRKAPLRDALRAGDRPRRRRRQRRQRRGLRRGRPTAPRWAGAHVLLVTLGTGIGGGFLLDGRCTAARTASAPRSVTSPSIATGRCARAASAGTGRRSRRGPRSAAWPASSSAKGGGAAWSRRPAATATR